MFGYVQPDKSELKVKEYETYKAVYCSVCKSLGKNYGLLARFLLTYDSAFYVFLMKSVKQDEPDCAHKGVCRFNPLKKCNYIDNDVYLDEAAALTVIMFYYKIKDNIKDSGLIKRLLMYFVLPYITLKFKKAVKNYSYFDDIISLSMKEQAEAESDKNCITDKACDPSAKALGKIISYNAKGEIKQTLYRIGYCIGRWVYLTDAFDDLENDIKHRNFNPFITKYNLKTVENISKEVTVDICRSIRLTANETANALNTVNKNCYKNIVENIVFDGMENQLNKILKKRGADVNE